MKQLNTPVPEKSIKRKLVRNNYRFKIKEPRTTFIQGVEDFETLILEKLEEEQRELSVELERSDLDRSAVIDEAADVLEVLDTITFLKGLVKPEKIKHYISGVYSSTSNLGISRDDILRHKELKKIELGGFSLGVVWEEQN